MIPEKGNKQCETFDCPGFMPGGNFQVAIEGGVRRVGQFHWVEETDLKVQGGQGSYSTGSNQRGRNHQEKELLKFASGLLLNLSLNNSLCGSRVKLLKTKEKNNFQERTIARVVSQTIPRAFTDPQIIQVSTCQGAKVSLNTLNSRDPRKVMPE